MHYYAPAISVRTLEQHLWNSDEEKNAMAEFLGDIHLTIVCSENKEHNRTFWDVHVKIKEDDNGITYSLTEPVTVCSSCLVTSTINLPDKSLHGRFCV